jgi:hypothetical protein
VHPLHVLTSPADSGWLEPTLEGGTIFDRRVSVVLPVTPSSSTSCAHIRTEDFDAGRRAMVDVFDGVHRPRLIRVLADDGTELIAGERMRA